MTKKEFIEALCQFDDNANVYFYDDRGSYDMYHLVSEIYSEDGDVTLRADIKLRLLK